MIITSAKLGCYQQPQVPQHSLDHQSKPKDIAMHQTCRFVYNHSCTICSSRKGHTTYTIHVWKNKNHCTCTKQWTHKNLLSSHAKKGGAPMLKNTVHVSQKKWATKTVLSWMWNGSSPSQKQETAGITKTLTVEVQPQTTAITNIYIHWTSEISCKPLMVPAQQYTKLWKSAAKREQSWPAFKGTS